MLTPLRLIGCLAVLTASVLSHAATHAVLGENGNPRKEELAISVPAEHSSDVITQNEAEDIYFPTKSEFPAQTTNDDEYDDSDDDDTNQIGKFSKRRLRFHKRRLRFNKRRLRFVRRNSSFDLENRASPRLRFNRRAPRLRFVKKRSAPLEVGEVILQDPVDGSLYTFDDFDNDGGDSFDDYLDNDLDERDLGRKFDKRRLRFVKRLQFNNAEGGFTRDSRRLRFHRSSSPQSRFIQKRSADDGSTSNEAHSRKRRSIESADDHDHGISKRVDLSINNALRLLTDMVIAEEQRKRKKKLDEIRRRMKEVGKRSVDVVYDNEDGESALMRRMAELLRK